jgi:hypothetical protein
VAGKGKGGQACASCLVKAGLPPRSLIHPVVCSVCGGRGLVEAKGQAGPASWLILVFALILCVLGLGGGSAIAFAYHLAHPQENPVEPADGNGAVLEQTMPGVPN